MDFTDLQLDSSVKKIIKETRGLNVNNVSKQVGMSQTGFNKSLEKGTLRLFDFIKLCAALEKSVLQFIPEHPKFDEEGELMFEIGGKAASSPKTVQAESKKLNAMKDDLIKKQDTIIQLLEKVNQLEKENSELKSSMKV